MSATKAPSESAQMQEQAYREQVEKLVDACLHRIRHYELPTDSEPPAAVWPSDE